MKIEDIAKLVLEELKSQEVKRVFEVSENHISDASSELRSQIDLDIQIDDNEEPNRYQSHTKPRPLKTLSRENSQSKDEVVFLQNLKERLLVLFEGLNQFDRGDIEARVELTLKFLEFALASIDERSKNLTK